jgi:hypothetical protein
MFQFLQCTPPKLKKKKKKKKKFNVAHQLTIFVFFNKKIENTKLPLQFYFLKKIQKKKKKIRGGYGPFPPPFGQIGGGTPTPWLMGVADHPQMTMGWLSHPMTHGGGRPPPWATWGWPKPALGVVLAKPSTSGPRGYSSTPHGSWGLASHPNPDVWAWSHPLGHLGVAEGFGGGLGGRNHPHLTP